MTQLTNLERRTSNRLTDKLTQPINRPTIFGIWTGILSALLHSILDSNLSIVPANALHFYVLTGLLIASMSTK